MSHMLTLEAQNKMMRAALEAECGDRCNAEYNPCSARQTLNMIDGIFSSLTEYEDIEVSADELEAYLCQDRTYQETYPNAFLAIDVKQRKILINTIDEKQFILELRKYSDVKEMNIIETLKHK